MALLIFPTLKAAEDANALVSYLAHYTGDGTQQWDVARVRGSDGKFFIHQPDPQWLVFKREDGTSGPISEIVGPYTVEP